MKNTEKPIIEVIVDEWSETLEMLLGLDGNPCSYDDITDDSWSFKTRKKGKKFSLKYNHRYFFFT
jgi:hypothetical protein